MLSEELRLKPAMQPYWLAMSDMSKQLEDARALFNFINETSNWKQLPLRYSQILQDECIQKIDYFEERKRKIKAPLEEVLTLINTVLDPILDMYKKCIEELNK